MPPPLLPDEILHLLSAAAANNAEERTPWRGESSYVREVTQAFMEPGPDVATMMMRMNIDAKNPRVQAAIQFQWEQALYFENGNTETELKGALGEIVGLSSAGRSAGLKGLLSNAEGGRARQEAITVLTGGMGQNFMRRGFLGRFRRPRHEGVVQ